MLNSGPIPCCSQRTATSPLASRRPRARAWTNPRQDSLPGERSHPIGPIVRIYARRWALVASYYDIYIERDVRPEAMNNGRICGTRACPGEEFHIETLST
jgi:hypothetical protein